MGLTASNDIIEALRSRLGLDETVGIILRVWDKEFAHLFPYAELQGIKNNTLCFDVESNVHIQEFTLHKHNVIKRMNNYFGSRKPIKKIKIRIKS